MAGGAGGEAGEGMAGLAAGVGGGGHGDGEPAGADDAPIPRPLPPGEREPWPTLLRSMTRVGLNSFGGPVAQIGVMQEEAVERRKWLSDGQFVQLLNFANILPGPEATEVAIHLGWLRRGVAGGIVAGVLFILPGMICLTALAWVYQTYGRVPAIMGFFAGIRPVAAALIVAAGVRLATRALRGRLSYVLLFAAYALNLFLEAPFLAILAGCGLVGVLAFRRAAPAPVRAKEWQLAILVAGAVIVGQVWVVRQAGPPPAVVAAAARAEAPLVDVGWLNLKAALVTFGGAYTVLPFLREQAVGRYGWVTDEQMMDALALGETTPGPLISVGVFLSYLAAGLPGALVGAFFLFLPSFLFVLLLAPHLERVDRIRGVRAFLWGVSAGTLGLILGLSARILPAAVTEPLDAALALCAFAALWRWKANILLVVAIGGAIGIARGLLGG